MEKFVLLSVLCLGCVLVFGQNNTTTNAPYIKCGPGQVYNNCTNACTPAPTCQNPNPTPQTCSGFCLPQCVCDANLGLILDESTQTCVEKGKCPPVLATTTNAPYTKCGPGQVYNNCTNPCTPAPTCQNPNPTPMNCFGLCFPQCVCDANQGLILDASTQTCVEKGKCPPACKPEEQSGCAPCGCPEATCQDPTPSCPGDVACIRCDPFCVCKQGYLRDNSTGTCVPQDKCPSAA